MRTEIIISHGHVRLLNPIYLKPEAPIKYTIEIPDDVVAPTQDWFPEEFQIKYREQRPKEQKGSLQERYNQILGKMAKTRPATTISDDYQTLIDALEERDHGS